MQLHNYKKYLEDVLKVELGSETRVLSAVFPLPEEKVNFPEISTKYKSFIREEFRRQNLNTNDFLEQDLNLAIQETEQNIDLNKKGHFSMIVFSTSGEKGEKFVKNYTSFPLWIRPARQSSYIGCHPKPVHLFQNYFYDNESLVLTLHKDSAELFGYRQNSLKKLDEIETDFIDDYGAKEYIEQTRNPGKIDHVHGSGEDKNQDLEVSRAFFREELLPFLEKNMNQNHKKIFVLHQDGGVFYQLKDFLKEEIEKQQIETVFMEKSPEDENEILEIVENQIWQEIVDDEKNFLAQKEEDPASFETDLFKVFKACQAGKIERLYLNYRISSNEVNLNLFNDNLMGDEPRFKAIEEIYIWLAYKTLEYGGEIFPSECEENKNKLVAKLRY